MASNVLKKTFCIVFLWRVGLFCVGLLAPKLLSYQPSFPYAYDLLAKIGLPQWLYSWANFDGVHYLTIMQKGYIGTGLIQAFFPVFPLAIAGISLGLPHVVTALLANFVAFWLALFFLFFLVKSRSSARIAWSTLALLLVFPTSFFYGAVYSEAFFLVCTLGAFLAAQKKRWALAALATGLAVATRVVGVFVLAAVVIELFAGVSLKELPKAVIKNARNLLLLAFSLSGLAVYMLFLQYEFRDPLYFFHVQSEFGSGRQESLVLLPQTLWRGLKILLSVPISMIWVTYAQEFIFSVLAFSTLAFGFWKRREYKLPMSWLIFALGVLVLPTLTGTLSSMPRYLLAAFPLFFIWAQLLNQNKIIRVMIFLLSLGLLLYNSVLFIQGYWIA